MYDVVQYGSPKLQENIILTSLKVGHGHYSYVPALTISGASTLMDINGDHSGIFINMEYQDVMCNSVNQ